jgi:hypothetical protein
MPIEFIKFAGKAPVIEAVQVTEDNLEQIAVWIGADKYSVETTLTGGERRVVFDKIDASNYSHAICRAVVGEYLVKQPPTIDVYNRESRVLFFSQTQKEIDEFVKQQRDTGEIDISAAPYDR